MNEKPCCGKIPCSPYCGEHLACIRANWRKHGREVKKTGKPCPGPHVGCPFVASMFEQEKPALNATRKETAC